MKVFAAIALALVSASVESKGILPPKTLSEVCPALDFEQGSTKLANGQYMFRFEPEGQYPTFKFVDIHVVLENAQQTPVSEVR